MAPRRNRRGVEALEFALTLPLLLAMISGMIDFGWYYYQAMSLQEAVRLGARAGVTEPRDGDPIGRATSAAMAAMEGMPYTATLTVTLPVDGTGDQLVRVAAEADYVGLWAMLQIPWHLDAVAAMRCEDQPVL